MLEVTLVDHLRSGWTIPAQPPTPHARLSGASPTYSPGQPLCASVNLPAQQPTYTGTQAIKCISVVFLRK
jgi:hypothetical protein